MARFKKGDAKPTNSGRKKGSVNKSTSEMREMVYEAFELAGGVKYLLTQSKVNPKAFLALAAKLIPQAVDHTIEGNIPLLILRQDYVKGQTTEEPQGDDAAG